MLFGDGWPQQEDVNIPGVRSNPCSTGKMRVNDSKNKQKQISTNVRQMPIIELTKKCSKKLYLWVWKITRFKRSKNHRQMFDAYDALLLLFCNSIVEVYSALPQIRCVNI